MRHAPCTKRQPAATSRARRPPTAPRAVALLVALTVIGCAGKPYVQREVERLDNRLATVDRERDATAAALTDHEDRLAETERLATLASERAHEAEHLLRAAPAFETAYTVDGIRFPAGSSRLSTEAETLLDQLTTRLELEDRESHLEIRASADDLGKARGMAVRRHLHVAGGVPLHAMHVLPSTDAVAGGDTTSAPAVEDGQVAIAVLRPPSLP